jgi:hypothetical protein
MEKQLKSAEDKPLGRVKNDYAWDLDSMQGRHVQYRTDAAQHPANGFVRMFPVGRTSAVCIPGSEANGEGYKPMGAIPPTPSRKR